MNLQDFNKLTRDNLEKLKFTLVNWEVAMKTSISWSSWWDEKVKADNNDDTAWYLSDKVDWTTLSIDTTNHIMQVIPWVFEPAFTKKTGFNLNLWTTAWTVSEWNHNHKLNNLSEKSYNSLTDTPDLSIYELKANKLTAFQTTPDDTHYISEKLSKDSLDLKQNILTEWAFVDWDKTKLDWIAYNANKYVITSDIDDTTTSTTKVYSSDKTQTALDGKEPTITKNTAFNKDFWTTAWTVLEWNTNVGIVWTKEVDETFLLVDELVE